MMSYIVKHIINGESNLISITNMLNTTDKIILNGRSTNIYINKKNIDSFSLEKVTKKEIIINIYLSLSIYKINIYTNSTNEIANIDKIYNEFKKDLEKEEL